jgi:DNA-directed RNA polymerase specialized sigma24 family protein
MVNNLRDKARRAAVRKAHEPVLWEPQPTDGVEAVVLINMEAQAAYKFIQTLPAKQRMVLILVWDGWTTAEIAEATQTDPHGVSGNLYAARRKVRKHLKGWQ